jgi:hypothetical protein
MARGALADGAHTLIAAAPLSEIVDDGWPIDPGRVLGALISLHLLEAAATPPSGEGSRDALRDLMDAVSQRARERGLTEDILQEILAEAEAARREE